MAIMLPTARRKDGEEQPYIPMGIFKFRLPFVHWGVEIPEVLQAMVMFVTGMAACTALQDVFGMPFEVALSIVCFHELTYCLHQILGDPIIPGWISPALPIMVAFLTENFEPGIDRIHALIATQLLVGVLFLVLGITGLARKLVEAVPKALQAGIILGAGISAIIGKYCFAQGGGFFEYPISITVGGLLALYILYNKSFGEKVRSGSSSILTMVANYGIMPGVFAGIVVGWIVGEIPLPQFEPGLIFVPRMKEVISTYSIFGAGIPPLSIWVKTIPMAIVAYIIAFGDIIIGQTVVMEANRDFRPDEKVDGDTNRLNLLCAIRNFLEGCIAPTVTLAGPLWAAMTVAVAERYKLGRKAMDSIFGGAGTFNIMKFLSCLILPLVCIFKPALPVALALTLFIQGFACTYIAVSRVKTYAEWGIAGITGGALAVGGPAMGLGVGLVLCLLILGKEAFTMAKDEAVAPAAQGE